jgi:hypothetical protein
MNGPTPPNPYAVSDFPQPSPYVAPQPSAWPQNPYGAPPPQWAGNQSGQPPGWDVPPPKNGRRRWWLAVPVVVVGVAVYAVLGLSLVKDGVEIASATISVSEYAQAIVDGQHAEAYAMRCDADRATTSLEQFTADHDAAYLGYRVESVSVQEADGFARGDARLRLHVLNTPGQVVDVTLYKIDGDWRPCDTV